MDWFDAISLRPLVEGAFVSGLDPAQTAWELLSGEGYEPHWLQNSTIKGYRFGIHWGGTACDQGFCITRK